MLPAIVLTVMLTSLSVAAMCMLTLREHNRAGWSAATLGAVGWLTAPVLLYWRLDSVDLVPHVFGLTVAGINAVILIATAGRPILVMHELLPDEYSSAERRRGKIAQGVFLLSVVGIAIGTSM